MQESIYLIESRRKIMDRGTPKGWLPWRMEGSFIDEDERDAEIVRRRAQWDDPQFTLYQAEYRATDQHGSS
tara:strand:- start:6173 stop:6385 length:213 start_codon:yes stop_codon:yes gene_type:complete